MTELRICQQQKREKGEKEGIFIFTLKEKDLSLFLTSREARVEKGPGPAFLSRKGGKKRKSLYREKGRRRPDVPPRYGR